jgi:hypothetical protein
VQLQRLYPGGPARARFIGRHGPDGEIVGGFTLTAPNSESLPRMMAQGVQRMDQLFARALAAGMLVRDSSLDLPPPPELPQVVEDTVAAPTQTTNAFQVQISASEVNIYNFAMAHLRTLPGIESASPQQINPSGTSYVLVSYRGPIESLAAALTARGWATDFSGTVVRIRSASGRPPPIPPPVPVPQPQPATPPPAQPQPASNQVAGREQ